MKMKSKLWLSMALTSLALLSVLPLSVQLLTTQTSVAQNSPRAKKISLQTYQVPNEFSILYPSGWFVQRSPQRPGATPRELIIITNLKPQLGGGRVPTDLIKTDIAIEPGTWQTVVNETLSSNEPGTRLTSREQTKVDGREAVTLWFSGSETNTAVTLIRYNPNETIAMRSFYHTNPSAIPIIRTIHWSLKFPS